MSKKKVIILSIVLILSIAYISRVAYINIVYGPIEVTQYSVGDKVKICNTKYQIINSFLKTNMKRNMVN